MIRGKNILLGLTTTPKSNWRDKVQEIRDFNIKELALLPTGLDIEQRKELYLLLEATPLSSIPYCYLRDDFIEPELIYLIDRFKTKVFSVHADLGGLALQNKLAKYSTSICVENPLVFTPDSAFDKDIMAQHQVIGVCLDLVRYQLVKDLDKKGFKKLEEVLAALPAMANIISPYHLTAMQKLLKKPSNVHFAESLHEFDYLKEIADKYFSPYLVMDLENYFMEQQEIIKYIEFLTKDK